MVKLHRQGDTFCDGDPVLNRGIVDGPLDAVEFDDACDGGSGPLEVVELLGEAVDGHYEHLCVVEDQIDGAESDPAAEVEVSPEGQRYGAPHAEHEHRGAKHDAAHESGFEGLLVPVSHQLVETEHHIGLGVVRTNVLGARETLLQEAERVGAGLAIGLPVGDGDGANAG